MLMTRPLAMLALLLCGVAWLTVRPAPPAIVAEAAPQQSAGALGDILGPPSLTAAQVDAILARQGSPAAGTGAAWVELSRAYGIDDAYALAFFQHESSMATDPNWAGWKADGSSTHSIGNIVCAGWHGECVGRFRGYPDWRGGIEDWYRLIANEYVSEGRTTVATIIPKYAPAFENDVDNYVRVVNALVSEWRSE